MLTTQLTLREYLDVLRRRRWVVLLVFGVTVLLGVLPVSLGDATYASTASLQVTSEETGPFDNSDPNVQGQVRSVLTDVERLKTSGLRALVNERLGPEAEPFDAVSAALIGFSEVIEVTVTAGSPAAAADAANAYADVFVEQRRRESNEALVAQSDELRGRAEAAQGRVTDIDRQLADPATDPAALEGLRLERSSLALQVSDFGRRADQLEVEAALREGGIQVLSRATLELDPVGTSPVQAGFVAGVLGLLAGLALAVILDIVQDRLSSRDDLDVIAPDLSVLASIPHMPDVADPTPEAVEAYRYLSTTLEFSRMRTPFRSVVITSAVSSEGKTTTAVHLARAMAEMDQRVVLVDADIRRTGVHRELGLPNRVGLSSVLAGETDVESAIHYVEPRLAVLTAGPASAVANELVGSDEFAALMEELAAQCDLLIVDAPPVLPVADPLLVARAVDVAIVVSRIGVVRRREVRATIRRFREASLPLVGLVANDAQPEKGYVAYHAAPATEASPAAQPEPAAPAP